MIGYALVSDNVSSNESEIIKMNDITPVQKVPVEMADFINSAAVAGHSERERRKLDAAAKTEADLHAAHEDLFEEWRPLYDAIKGHMPNWAHEYLEDPKLPAFYSERAYFRTYNPSYGYKPVILRLPLCTPIYVYALESEVHNDYEINYIATQSVTDYYDEADPGEQHYIRFERVDLAGYNMRVRDSNKETNTFDVAVADARDKYAYWLRDIKRVEEDNAATLDMSDDTPTKLQVEIDEIEMMLEDEELRDYAFACMTDVIQRAARNLCLTDDADSWAAIFEVVELMKDDNLRGELQQVGEALDMLLAAFKRALTQSEDNMARFVADAQIFVRTGVNANGVTEYAD